MNQRRVHLLKNNWFRIAVLWKHSIIKSLNHFLIVWKLYQLFTYKLWENVCSSIWTIKRIINRNLSICGKVIIDCFFKVIFHLRNSGRRNGPSLIRKRQNLNSLKQAQISHFYVFWQFCQIMIFFLGQIRYRTSDHCLKQCILSSSLFDLNVYLELSSRDHVWFCNGIDCWENNERSDY